MAGICAADLVTTLWFVGKKGAMELNPIMRVCLEQGVWCFVAAKALSCMGPLALLEWARRRRPYFVTAMLRSAIALYIGFYGVVVWKANAPAPGENLSTEEMAQIIYWSSRPVTRVEISAARLEVQVPQPRGR
ncbi:MAG: DUF5658 family protein [Chthonomonadales bacterium]